MVVLVYKQISSTIFHLITCFMKWRYIMLVKEQTGVIVIDLKPMLEFKKYDTI